MEEIDVFRQLGEVADAANYAVLDDGENDLARKVARHKLWLKSIRHEQPSLNKHFKIGVYIRFFNQTKYEDYLDYHKKQFCATISQCVNWELVDFYVDMGSTPPNMESSPEWCRLIDDCMDGKVDLIITQKTTNVSTKMPELALCARILAAQTPPIGIYFISEDLFTLATYHLDDLRDTVFLVDQDEDALPGDSIGLRGLPDD